MRRRVSHKSSKAPRSAVAPSSRPLHARGTLVIMAKQPVMGRVKTRLARQTSATEALRFYRNAVRTVASRLAADRRWRTVLAIAPDTAICARVWPSRCAKVAQGRGDLGARMQRLLELPAHGPVVLVGTDIPSITPAHIAAAFRLLGSHDVVFGPAADGGFWLVGLKRMPALVRPFADIRWSTADTLAESLANCAGHRVALASTLSDVDDAADLRRLGPTAARFVPTRVNGAAGH